MNPKGANKTGMPAARAQWRACGAGINGANHGCLHTL